VRVPRFGRKLTTKLDQQDAGKSDKGRRANDRGAYTRFNRAIVEAELRRSVKADLHSDLFSYHIDEAAIQNAEALDGTFVLLTNAEDLSAQDIVARYKALADIERGFRVLKSDLEIAPVFHRLPDRIRTHALICFLALILHRVMQMRLKASGSANSPKRVLELLRPLQRHRVKIGAQQVSSIGRVTPEQLELFKNLQIPASN
jgi:transposase